MILSACSRFESLLLCVVLFLLPVLARAQALPPVRESVVVTATLSPEEESEIGEATTVVTRERIEATGVTTVLEALRLVPGLDVVRSGSEGSVTSVFLRGSNSTHALVLVDGVRVNSPYFSGYDFSALTTENVERIEVVRGPFSPLYGSDAVGGVIQIFTRPAPAVPAARVALEGGNSGQRRGTAFLSSGQGPASVTASYHESRVDGDRDNADWLQRNASLRLDAQLGEKTRVSLEGAVLDGESGVPGPVGAETPRARGGFREERVAVPVSFEPAPEHDAQVLVARVRSTPSFRNPGDPFFSSSDTDARTLQVRASDTWNAGQQSLTAFASWERWTVSAESSFGSALDDDRSTVWGAGILDSFRFASRGSATFGLRVDRHSEFGSAVSPRASASWLSPESRWKVRASAGTAFRAPSVGELFFPQVGNENLEPERSRSFEVGLERYVRGGRGDASLFWNEYRDLIVVVFDPPSLSFRNENVGRARTRGIELAWRQDVSETVSLDAGYTYLDAEDRTSGEPLLRRPDHRAYLAAVVRPLPRLLLTLRATFVGRREDVDALTFGRTALPSYVRWDLYARCQLLRFSPYLRLENAADRFYEEADGFPAPRRRVAAGLEWRSDGAKKG